LPEEKREKTKKFYVWIFSLESCRLLLKLLVVLQEDLEEKIRSFYFIFSTVLIYFCSYKKLGEDTVQLTGSATLDPKETN
jgi:hypothetical protein